MVQAPSPIHSDVRLLLIKFHSTCWIATSRQLTELKQAIKYRTNGLTSLHLLAILRHVIWADGAQEFNVVITVVLGHLLSIGTHINFHFSIEAIVEQQIVSHADSVRLHWMALSIICLPQNTQVMSDLEVNSSASKFSVQKATLELGMGGTLL
uniref:Uncharacterized protein n=1 Tax=Sciurus vulgaris TaxID=55149 RepID=A0A8D2DLZ9_SCIVU